MVFEIENATYEQHRQDWLTQGFKGKFVVIKGDDVLGHFDSFPQAFEKGSAKFGDTFLVKAVTDGDDVQIIQRVTW